MATLVEQRGDFILTALLYSPANALIHLHAHSHVHISTSLSDSSFLLGGKS